MDKEEKFVEQSALSVSVDRNLMKEHHSLDEESLAGVSKEKEYGAPGVDETLRGYRSEDESLSRGYYTNKFDNISQAASTSTPKRQDKETSFEKETNGDFEILKDGLASPKTLERKKEFAWQQFLAREKQKEELYKQFEAGQLKAALQEAEDDSLKKQEEYSEGASRGLIQPEADYEGRGLDKTEENGKAKGSVYVVKQNDTQERQRMKSIRKVGTGDINANNPPVKNKYQDPKVLTYPSSAQTSAQDCKRPIPTVADIEAMISSVKVGMNGNQNGLAGSGFPVPRREPTFRATRPNKGQNEKQPMSTRLHSAPPPMKLMPVPTYPPPPTTYNAIPTLPIPSAAPTFSPRPLPLAPPDLSRPPPGFSFPPMPTPYVPAPPPPPSAFPIPILSHPPPIAGFTGGPTIYPSPPSTREICTPENERFEEKERRVKVKKSKSRRRLLSKSPSRDSGRNRSREKIRRSRSGEKIRSRDRENDSRETRSRSLSRERTRPKQNRKRSKIEKLERKKSTSRIEKKLRSCSGSPERDLPLTDTGNSVRAVKGTQAFVKEYINNETGILEILKGPGQQGPVVLFHINQLWILDKKIDQQGDPIRFNEVGHVSVRDLVPVGQLVLANIRSVRSQFVDFQATVIWPSSVQQPPYTVNPADLNDQLTAFHSANSLDTFLPLCIAGAETQGPTRMWKAAIKEIIDENWGIIEVNSTNNERNSNARPKFCLFNKEDVWLADGLHVADHEFFMEKPLADLVAVGDGVNITARNIAKGDVTNEGEESGVDMQALCVSLQTDVIPPGAGSGVKLLGGPGTIGGICNDQTPYMFEMDLAKKLNRKVANFIEETGRKYENIDGRFLEVKVKEEIVEIVENNNNTTERIKKIHKITHIEEMARLYQSKTGVSLGLPETPEHMDCKEGIVIRILDDNFGIIQHEDFNVLFDTCDLWISSQFTAAKKLQKLQNVIKVGVRVIFHAALIDKAANIPYLASAVWPAEATFFDDPVKFPAPIRKESIHVDKIDIYKMVSETVNEPLLKEKIFDEKLQDNLVPGQAEKSPQYLSQHVHALEGIVKVGIKLKSKPELFCGIVEFVAQDIKNETTDNISYAFFMSKCALEEHEKSSIAVPKNRVFFNASQFKDLGPISYLITTVSKVHKVLPHEVISRTTESVDEIRRILCNILAQNLPEITLIKSSAFYGILTLETRSIEELIGPSLVSDVVIDCRDGCRLVCMLNKDSGVLEDSNRNLCYFERSDLNLETEVGLHDLVVLFTRINLIKIRFQATEMEEVARLGPIKLVAHDKSVKISGDIGERLPDVKKCASNYGKYEDGANRISIEKSARAKEAAIMFKLGNYLKPEFILDSPDFKPHYDVGKKKDIRKPIMRKSILGEFKSRENVAVDKSKPTKRMRNRSKSRERYFSSPQRIIRTSNKEGKFETRSQSRRKETLKKESKVKKNQTRRPSSEDTSTKRKKKLVSFVGKNKRLQTKETLSSCKIVERHKGKVRSILNENFGLIEFYMDLKYPAYCLFDTHDLFIENDETAAQGKLTVGNVLSLDMEVSFNACELQPLKAVPWLATAVWRTDGSVDKFPLVVEPQNIKEEKVEVFKKMAETCEVLVFNLLKPVGAAREDEVVLERKATDLEELEKRRERRRRSQNDEEETNPKFLEERRRDLEVVRQTKAYKAYARECPRDKRETRDPVTPDRFLIQSKTNWEESLKDWEMEIHAWYREQSKEFNQKRKRIIRDTEEQVKKKRRRSRSPERSGHLPSKIYDHVTSGTLEHVVSELYAVVRLNSPPGAKAILHYDRVWVDDHQIFGGWRVLNYGWFQDLRINARRINVDGLGVDYQVTFAHVGIRSYDPKRGVYNYKGRMAKFVEDRKDTGELDRELDKCLALMRK